MARPLLLLVDDAPEIARLVQLLARRAGQEVVCRGDVPSAWNELHDGSPLPDLILLDVNLPGASGLELYRRLLREGGERARLPVALFTQWSLPTVIAEGINSGIDFLAAKELLAQPDGWKERIEEILALAAQPPILGGAREGGGRAALAQVLAGLHGALRQPALRRLGQEVMQAVWRRALRRAAGAADTPDVDIWMSAAKLTQTLTPLADSRPGFAADLPLALAYQAECLLGRADSEPLRTALAAGPAEG